MNVLELNLTHNDLVALAKQHDPKGDGQIRYQEFVQ